MSYTPKSTPVYLAALGGFIAGIATQSVDTKADDYAVYSQMADVWAQQVDQTFFTQIGAPTGFQIQTLLDAAEAMWENKSPLPASAAFAAGNYSQLASAIVARVKQANAQVVSEGVDPNNTGGGGGGGGSSTPLTHGQWIDGSTVTAPATQNGFIGTPWSTIQKWLSGMPASASAADSGAIQIGFLTPSAAGMYTENPVVPAYRSVELHGMDGVSEIIGNFTCANTLAGAGATPAPTLVFQIYKNLLIDGSFTFTDDGTVPAILCFEADTTLESEVAFAITTTGATAIADIILANELAPSGVTSTANATGAIVAIYLVGTVGNCTCQAMQVAYAGLSGTAYTVNASATCNVAYSLFSGVNPVLTGGTWNMDQMSYNSFIGAGGTLAGGATIVVAPYTNFLTAPTAMGAGAAVVGAPGASNNFLVTLTGAQPQYTTNPTPVLGELVRFKSSGTGGTPLKLVANAGQQLEIPGAPGTFTGVAGNTSFAAGNGGALTYSYDGVAKWYIVATV